jgi:hypothetical protein
VRHDRFSLRLATAGLLLFLLLPPITGQTGDTLPATLSDSEFWSLSQRISEPDGSFRSNSGSTDNLLSNEPTLSGIAAALADRAKVSSVYLGVGPEQNFTYIAASRPRMAFITDIRRGNLHLHLMYKALFELSENRVDFASLLFTRIRAPGLTSRSTAREIMNAYLKAARGDEAVYKGNLKAISDHLTRTRRLPLGPDDLAGIEYVYRNFYRFGPGIHYLSSLTDGGAGGQSYATLMSTTTLKDGAFVERSYLASEDHFAFVKTMEERNLIVPVVGDFAGTKALRTVGTFLRERGAVVSVFYVSNVESYLKSNGVWPAFCANVAAMPLDSSSMFVRYGTGGQFGGMAFETAACAKRVVN